MSASSSTHRPPREPSLWQAPLVPVALALTLGIVLDHFIAIPLPLSLVLASLLVVAWAVLSAVSTAREWSLLALLSLTCVIGAARHHHRYHLVSAKDVGSLAEVEPRPVRVRGVLADEPRRLQRRVSKLYPVYAQSKLAAPMTIVALRAESIRNGEQWMTVTGRAKVIVTGEDVPTFHEGDTVEVIGLLELPRGPSNPGEVDYAQRDRERGIHCTIFVKDARNGVTRLRARSATSVRTWLAIVRGYGERTLQQSLPPKQSRIAQAILLGRVDALTGEELDKFKQSGVVHVLVISGQHFFVLAVFVQFVLRLCRVEIRRRAAIVALLLIAYAFLVGLRPPVLRATVTFCALFGGMLLRRVTLFPNAFALAWIVVVLINPREAFSTGCQLSFLAVAVLYWIVGGSLRAPAARDPLDKLIAEARPAWQQVLIRLGRGILLYYLTTLIVWLTLAPLVAARSHLIPIAGLLIAPPVMIAIAAALVCGFLLLLTAWLAPPLAMVFARLMEWSLSACDAMIDAATQRSLTYHWVGDVPTWWLIGFYLLIAVAVFGQCWPRHRARLITVALLWLCFGLLPIQHRRPNDELRVTFLDVGHGTCVVLELPDGRVLLYDAGSIRNPGPNVTRRRIAPYLWHRGIRRIDELFLSHADLDHYNGVPDLVERFAIGQVSCNPSFAAKQAPEVQATLDLFRSKGIPIRTVEQGNLLIAGSVQIEVLHPPASGPKGEENVRSLVLRIEHGDHRILLTGDVEGAGMHHARPLLRQSVDVLMAPHHGSMSVPRDYVGRNVAPSDLAAWVTPRIVVSSQGLRHNASQSNPYVAVGARYLTTWEHGAVTVRSHASGLVVETFRTDETLVIRK